MDDEQVDEIAKRLMADVNKEYKKLAEARTNTKVSASEIIAQIIFWVAAFESFGFDTPVEVITELGKQNSLQMKEHSWVTTGRETVH